MARELQKTGFRLRLRTLVLLVGVLAVSFWAGVTYWSPTRRLGRLVQLDQPAYVRREAAGSLGNGIPPWEVEQAVSILIGSLKDPNPMVQVNAASALGEHDSRAERAIPHLLKVLKGPDRFARFTAARALGQVTGPNSEQRSEVVAALVNALADRDVDNRMAASEALITLGELPKAALTMASSLSGPDKRLQAFARMILRRQGTDIHQLVPWLDRELQNEDVERRIGALEILMDIDAPEHVRAALQDAALSDVEFIRQWAKQKLEAIDVKP
jgi:HEAT repeat protein